MHALQHRHGYKGGRQNVNYEDELQEIFFLYVTARRLLQPHAAVWHSEFTLITDIRESQIWWEKRLEEIMSSLLESSICVFRLFLVDVFTARVLGKFKIPLPSFMFPSWNLAHLAAPPLHFPLISLQAEAEVTRLLLLIATHKEGREQQYTGLEGHVQTPACTHTAHIGSEVKQNNLHQGQTHLTRKFMGP